MPDDRSFPTRRHFLLASLGISAVLVTGCGQGEYEQRMGGINGMLATRAAAAGKSSGDSGYHSISDASGPTGIKFKLPAVFAAGTKLTPDMPGAKITQADIPGFCYSYQAMLADNNNRQIPA
jgi:hypothetical protein